MIYITNLELFRWIELSFVLLIDRDVDIIVGEIIGSSVTINEDEPIVRESSAGGSALAFILSFSLWCNIGDELRSFVPSELVFDDVVAVKFLYLDTCCLCHCCNSRVINSLKISW